MVYSFWIFNAQTKFRFCPLSLCENYTCSAVEQTKTCLSVWSIEAGRLPQKRANCVFWKNWAQSLLLAYWTNIEKGYRPLIFQGWSQLARTNWLCSKSVSLEVWQKSSWWSYLLKPSMKAFCPYVQSYYLEDGLQNHGTVAAMRRLLLAPEIGDFGEGWKLSDIPLFWNRTIILSISPK